MKKNFYSGILASVLMILSSATLYAESSIKSNLTVMEEYNDNMMLTKNDKQHDFITTVIPRIELRHTRDKLLDLTFNYSLYLRFFSRHSDLNTTNLGDAQNANLALKISPSERFFVDISDIYQRTAIDIRQKTAPGVDVINMTDSNLFSISPNFVLPVTPTISTTLGYKYENRWYKDTSANDSYSQSGFVTLTKNFSSQLTGILRYKYYVFYPDVSETSVTPVEKYDRQDASAGISYKIMPDFEVNGEFGKSKFDFHERGGATKTFWDVGADYRKGDQENVSVGAKYGVSYNDSIKDGVFESRQIDAFFRIYRFLGLVIHPYYADNKYFDADREDIIKSIALYMSQHLSPKLLASINVEVGRHRYLPEKEKVKLFNLDSRIDYNMFRHVVTSIGYRYSNRISNLADKDDFNVNIPYAKVSVTF